MRNKTSTNIKGNNVKASWYDKECNEQRKIYNQRRNIYVRTELDNDNA